MCVIVNDQNHLKVEYALILKLLSIKISLFVRIEKKLNEKIPKLHSSYLYFKQMPAVIMIQKQTPVVIVTRVPPSQSIFIILADSLLLISVLFSYLIYQSLV